MARDAALGAVSQKIAGEWLLGASIMQCDDAIFGRVHFTEDGEMVYLAGGGDLIGRGVGRWVSEGPVVGFQTDIFQYASTSTNHVQTEPHRFRGIAKIPNINTAQGDVKWIGEWYFCPFQQPPRFVGHFHAHRTAAGLLGYTKGSPEDCPQEPKKEVIKKLDKMVEVPPMLEPKWNPHSIKGDVSDVHYVRNFLEPRQVEEFERMIDKTCEWERMMTRDTQEFGSSAKCPCGRSLLRVELPQWQNTMVSAIHALGIFHPVLYPANSVRINAYTPGQGIYPHLDGPVYYPRAAIVTLGSQCVFDFYPRLTVDENKSGFSWDRDKEVPAAPELPPGTKPALSLVLEPGSLLVFSWNSFIHHRHGIAAVEEDEITSKVRNAKDIGLTVGDRLSRGRRVSITVRHLLPRCMCSSMV